MKWADVFKIAVWFWLSAAVLNAHADTSPTSCKGMDVSGEWQTTYDNSLATIKLTQMGCATLSMDTVVVRPYSASASVSLEPDGKTAVALNDYVAIFNTNQQRYKNKVKVLSAQAVSTFDSDSQGVYLKVDITGTAEESQSTKKKFDFSAEIIVTKKKVGSCSVNCGGILEDQYLKLWIGHVKVTKAYDGSSISDVKSDLATLWKAPGGVLEDLFVIRNIESMELSTLPYGYNCFVEGTGVDSGTTFGFGINELLLALTGPNAGTSRPVTIAGKGFTAQIMAHGKVEATGPKIELVSIRLLNDADKNKIEDSWYLDVKKRTQVLTPSTKNSALPEDLKITCTASGT